ncbi:MAG: DNA-directed RNA polymerase subunit alpha C-terminal domain-containing protein [bacterium]
MTNDEERTPIEVWAEACEGAIRAVEVAGFEEQGKIAVDQANGLVRLAWKLAGPKIRTVVCRCGKTFTTTNPNARFCHRGCSSRKMWLTDEELLDELRTKTQSQVAREHGVTSTTVSVRRKRAERRRDRAAEVKELPGGRVEDLELSVRSMNGLQGMGIEMISELILCTEEDLVASKMLGRKSLKEIKGLLAENGMQLRR